jgi:hypothetical protein
MNKKIWCKGFRTICFACYDSKILCSRPEKEGISYLDCPFAIAPKGEFETITTCQFCQSTDVDSRIVYYPNDNYNRIIYTCNNCGNTNE